MEKSLFSPMAVYSVDLVGCHAIVDYLHMPDQAFLSQAVSAAYTNIFIHDIYVIVFDIIWHKLWPFMCCHVMTFMRCVPVQFHDLLLSHYLYHSLLCETVVQFYEITCDDSMCTHIQVFDSVPLESLLLRLHLDT